MFNSLSSYLFGGNELDYQVPAEAESDDGEQLNTQQEEDWVLVGNNAGHKKKKANRGSLSRVPPSQQQRLHSSGRPSPSSTCHCVPSTPTTSDSELLDDADTLAELLGLHDFFPISPGSPFGSGRSSPQLLDCDNVGLKQGGLRPSSPESVFSASSGRSHATYRVFGTASEPWHVAPTPCFMHDPLASCSEGESMSRTNVENLLIEHPSMSVYMCPLLSYSSAGLSAPGESLEAAAASTDRSQRGEDLAFLAARRHLHAVNNVINASPTEMVKQAHKARLEQNVKSSKGMSRQRCGRENLVHHHACVKKGQNKHNKRVRPTGFKASRVSQRSY